MLCQALIHPVPDEAPLQTAVLAEELYMHSGGIRIGWDRACGRGGGGAYSFAALLYHLTIDHAYISLNTESLLSVCS